MNSFGMLLNMAMLKYWFWWTSSAMLLLQSKFGLATANRYTDILLWARKICCCCMNTYIHLGKKGTKAVTGAVPFQKVNFCSF